MRMLVIAAHPDDEVLGCGGTIARAVRGGDDVHIAILGEGLTSRQQDRADTDARDTVTQRLATLREQSHQAAAKLGVTAMTHFDLPDNRFDTVALLDVVKLVEGLIDKLNPDVVYTHHGGDLNIDHVITHRAVMTATRPIAPQSGSTPPPVRELLTFEVLSSTEWSFHRTTPAFQPNVFVDISETLDVKGEAMACYTTELREFPHPRSLEGIRTAAKRWGSVVGCTAAEAFELVRSIR